MLSCFAPRAFALTCVGIVVFAGAAHAERAPIVYAGEGRAAAPGAPDRLEGGADNSYGYGVQRRNGATLDLRRPVTTEARVRVAHYEPQHPPTFEQEPTPQEAERTDVAPGQGAPEWLEQERVGPPYQANGRWYVPTPEPGYEQTGTASWYGPQFHGQRTASGEVFDQHALTAAHPTLPIPSLVQVTNLENGREVIVRVNDRGPFVGERLIDLSHGAAEVLGFADAGHARVHVRYLGPAPRRVNVEAASGPAAPAPPAPAPAAVEEEGPRSLLPPSSMAVTELAGGPLETYSLPPPAQAPAAPGRGYYLQVGAFSDLANAQRARAEVAGVGPVVVDVRRSPTGAELFRVRLGPWRDVVEAEAARSELARLGYGEAILAAR